MAREWATYWRAASATCASGRRGTAGPSRCGPHRAPGPRSPGPSRSHDSAGARAPGAGCGAVYQRDSQAASPRHGMLQLVLDERTLGVLDQEAHRPGEPLETAMAAEPRRRRTGSLRDPTHLVDPRGERGEAGPGTRGKLERSQPLTDAELGPFVRSPSADGVGPRAAATHAEGMRRPADHEQVEVGGQPRRGGARLDQAGVDTLELQPTGHRSGDLLGVAEHGFVDDEGLECGGHGRYASFGTTTARPSTVPAASCSQ